MTMKTQIMMLLGTCLLLWSCDTKTKTVDSCGDGFVDPGEECDSTVGDVSCASLGYYDPLGTLTCTPFCRYDVSTCGGRCGDNLVDVEDGEECDGANLNGQSCQSMGNGGGTLVCGAGCRYDLTGCLEVCGNGIVEGQEACDDGGRLDSDGCSTSCVVEDGWHCDAASPSVCAPACGDGLARGDEACDGSELAGQSCVGLGYHAGLLACAVDCTLDTTDCEAAGRCGDGSIQAGYAEACDGDELAGQSCETLGFYGGTLACLTDCTGFNTTSCAATGACGDNLIQSAHGEVCDHLNLNGATCASRGWYGGELACGEDCTAYDETGCAETGRCGDTLIQGAYGEQCDGDNLVGQTCASRGYYGGTLSCFANCQGFNETACTGRCGDGVVQAGEGEVCDGTNLAGQSCTGLGYYGGALRCAADCRGFTDTSCTGRCGDGVVQVAAGEQCDGANHNSATCQTLGFYQGTLACDEDCQLVTSGCSASCGDGMIQAGFGEVCDGGDLAGQTCLSRGYYYGTLTCAADCRGYNESQCRFRCGDGFVQAAYGEVCDGANLGGETCASRGYYEGDLACNANCGGFVVSGCTGFCGDGSVQTAHAEVCDGANLNGQSCVTLGWYGGTLSCSVNCQTFGQAGCAAVGRCGDGTIQASYGEVCDGSNLAGATCASRGWYGGALACDPACRLFDETACAVVGRCGDGTIQASYAEVCDGANLAGQSCIGLGYYGGALGCASNCRSLDPAPCVAEGRCGDGIVQAAHGEECDSSNLAGATCATALATHPYGRVRCGADCRLVTAGCREQFIVMVDVPGGTFQRDGDPANLSTLSPFRLSATELTRDQFSELMGVDPSTAAGSSGVEDPVQTVNWYHALAFCNKLSLWAGLTPVYTVAGVDFATLTYGQIPTDNNATWNAATADWGADGYRLPTEMEWMWAAMGADLDAPGVTNTTGRLLAFAGSTGSNLVDDYVWHVGNSLGVTHPASTLLPNGLDLYDLGGNVWEWVWDWAGPYPVGAVSDYRGPGTGTMRGMRGGSRGRDAAEAAVAFRGNTTPGSRTSELGFRVARMADMCGDGVVQTSYGEECDGGNLNGATCANAGYYDGVLGCGADCRFDTTWCFDYCGDGVIQTGDGEECDGADLDGETCVSRGFSSGALACRDCRFDTDACMAVSPLLGALINVPPGTFQRDVSSINLSTITSGFKMSPHEVTRAQFAAVLGVDPSDVSKSLGTSDPVQTVNWYDAIAFCNKLSLMEGLTPVYAVAGVDFATLTYGQIPTTDNATWNAATTDWGADGYRLPTEMEWMWAAMGADTANPGAINTTGYSKNFAGFTGTNGVWEYAWYSGNSGGTTHPVGIKLPNELALYDLSGNVFEWVWDWSASYPTGTLTDYRGPASGTSRVKRGGSWNNNASYCTVAFRTYGYYQYDRNNVIGFRVVRP